jgi:predicted enzyme related to lactoylglutathione lyase
VELTTPDPAAAAAFYGALLGWEHDGDGAFRLGGDVVAGIRQGTNSGWTSAVTVEDAAAVAARAVALGGRADGDRIEDPHGAALAVYEPRTRMGAERVNDPGCLCMNELLTSDLDAAAAFYGGLFGWTTERFGADMMLALNRGSINASYQPLGNGAAPQWRACFTVESAKGALARAVHLGGRAVGEPIELPDGGLAVAADPHGAVFSLFEGETDA